MPFGAPAALVHSHYLANMTSPLSRSAPLPMVFPRAPPSGVFPMASSSYDSLPAVSPLSGSPQGRGEKRRASVTPLEGEPHHFAHVPLVVFQRRGAICLVEPSEEMRRATDLHVLHVKRTKLL